MRVGVIADDEFEKYYDYPVLFKAAHREFARIVVAAFPEVAPELDWALGLDD